MAPNRGDGSSPAPIDRPILEMLQSRLRGVDSVERAVLSEATGHLELRATLSSSYYPDSLDEATLSIRWYTNDDFSIHYREVHPGQPWECRWDRHPNPHNSRDHVHPPPTAPTPGEDASWPTDVRDVVALVLDEIQARVASQWNS